jgi:hypothetical protein
MVVCRGGKSFFDGDGGVKILRSQKIFVWKFVNHWHKKWDMRDGRVNVFVWDCKK